MGLVARAVGAGRSRPAAAIVSQGVVSGATIGLLLVVSRTQGDRMLGQLALLLGVQTTLNAVQSGWVGDSLTVLDRFSPPLRSALQRYQLHAVLIVFTVALGVGLLVDGVSGRTAVLFAVMNVLWSIEETGRRLLIARREFWPLALNDLAYAVASFGWLFGAMATGRDVSMDLVMVSMCVGAVAAIALAAFQLPPEEYRIVRGAPAAMAEVASFAFWRALQVGLRPGALALTRFVVAAAASQAALGQLEAARIVMAPVLTLMGGIGVYLLPTYTQAIKQGRQPRPPIVTMMAALAAIPVVYALFVWAMKGPLVEILTDGKYVVTTTAIICWALYAGAFGAGIPPAHAVTATERSRLAFVIRAVDNGVGVALAVLIAVLASASWVPLGLAIGGVIGAALLLRSARDGSLAPAPVGVGS